MDRGLVNNPPSRAERTVLSTSKHLSIVAEGLERRETKREKNRRVTGFVSVQLAHERVPGARTDASPPSAPRPKAQSPSSMGSSMGLV